MKRMENPIPSDCHLAKRTDLPATHHPVYSVQISAGAFVKNKTGVDSPAGDPKPHPLSGGLFSRSCVGRIRSIIDIASTTMANSEFVLRAYISFAQNLRQLSKHPLPLSSRFGRCRGLQSDLASIYDQKASLPNMSSQGRQSESFLGFQSASLLSRNRGTRRDKVRIVASIRDLVRVWLGLRKPGCHRFVSVATNVILIGVEAFFAPSVPRCRRTCCLSGIDAYKSHGDNPMLQ